MPSVPYTTETLVELQARYPRALEYLYDSDAMVNKNAIRPGEVAVNVFDFGDGLRLLISRERLPTGKLILHVSASFRDKCQIADDFRRKFASGQTHASIAEAWAASIPAIFAELAKDPKPLVFLGWCRYIPHWIREEEDFPP